MFNLVRKRNSAALVYAAPSSPSLCNDLEDSEVHIVRGLCFAAGPTAVFWLAFILGIDWLLH
jgi:hypothetical protein